jgi:hypothetical protein
MRGVRTRVVDEEVREPFPVLADVRGKLVEADPRRVDAAAEQVAARQHRLGDPFVGQERVARRGRLDVGGDVRLVEPVGVPKHVRADLLERALVGDVPARVGQQPVRRRQADVVDGAVPLAEVDVGVRLGRGEEFRAGVDARGRVDVDVGAGRVVPPPVQAVHVHVH